MASQPSLAALPSTSLLRNKYLYLAPAFPQGLEAPAVKIHSESPITLVPSQIPNELAPSPRLPQWGPETVPWKLGSSWVPDLVMMFCKSQGGVAGEQVTGGMNHRHATLWLWLGWLGCPGGAPSQDGWLQLLLPSSLGLSPRHFELSSCVLGGPAGQEGIDGALNGTVHSGNPPLTRS